MDLVLDGTRWVRCDFLNTELLSRIKLESNQMQYRTYHVDLEGMVSSRELMERIATSIQFPGDFGKNWDALLDMLSDLRWDEDIRSGYVIFFEHANSLLQLAKEEALKFVLVCLSASECWQSGMEESGAAMPLIPFYIILDGGLSVCELIERGIKRGEEGAFKAN